jgi:Alpha 1,4-glycosyltransferase conserved region
MMTKMFHENCAITEPIITKNLQCAALNLTILLPKRGYPIHWFFVKDFFKPEKSAEVLKNTSDAYFIHTYSSISKKFEVNKSSTSAYVQLARRFCPRVFESSGESFA